MADPTIELLLCDLLTGIQSVIGERLVGLYLYGSLASGGYEPGISDVDLLAATDRDLTEIEGLRTMHAELARRHPEWDDRIEVAYLSVDALGSFKERRSSLVVISPGDPLHFTDAGSDWLMNWHLVTHEGRTLFGPAPAGFMTPTSHEEFTNSLRAHALTSDAWVDEARNCKAQSYVIFTMCRTLVAIHSDRHASKREAAAWVKERFPDWTGLVDRALKWRTDPESAKREDPQSFAEMWRFVLFVRDRAKPRPS